jgi:CubicO group peptidase (beta-lactamase class C family)
MGYSNGGYVLLGRIIEVVTGVSYYEYVRRHIFGPAGMDATAYLTLEEWPDDRAVGYAARDSGDTTPPGSQGGGAGAARAPTARRPNTWSLAWRGSAAGGGYASAGEMLRLDNALREGRILSPALADSIPSRMMTPSGPRVVIANGGGDGANFEFSHVGPYTVIVLSNYDPPSATRVAIEAQRILGAVVR